MLLLFKKEKRRKKQLQKVCTSTGSSISFMAFSFSWTSQSLLAEHLNLSNYWHGLRMTLMRVILTNLHMPHRHLCGCISAVGNSSCLVLLIVRKREKWAKFSMTPCKSLPYDGELEKKKEIPSTELIFQRPQTCPWAISPYVNKDSSHEILLIWNWINVYKHIFFICGPPR